LGRTTRISRIADYDLSLSPAEIDEEIDLLAEAWSGFEGGSVDQTRRYYREEVPRLVSRSAFSRLLVDGAGVAWLGQDRGDLRLRPPNQWELLSIEAGWLGTVRTPDGMSVIHVGRTKLVGVTKDQFDLATVVVLPFDRSDLEAGAR
jgi:hypothetical protein